MERNKVIELFDNEQYKEVYNITNPYKKEIISNYEVLYFLKSKIVLDNFKIKDKKEIKKLFFYYFYLTGKVEFENNYNFYFKKKLLKLDFNNIKKQIKGLKDFKQFFKLGKNNIFLNKIIDNSINQNDINFKQGAVDVSNLIDFFIQFTYECSELYAFSGENFPLFKWLINEIKDDG